MEKLKLKILCIITLFLVIVGCADPPKPIEKITPPRFEPPPFEISDVTANPRIFNPSKKETVAISYRLSRPGKAIVSIFDATMHLIRDIPGEEIGRGGVNKVVWDGRDLEGRVVPDEAYFFTIEVRDYQRNSAVYDPTTFSGGTYFGPPVQFDKSNGILSYQLAKDSRVRIRAGISGGPLLKTIVNWGPRLAGQNEEVWDGKDESGNIHVVNQKNYRLMVEAVSLPENSILTIGNTGYEFFKYRNDIAPDRPKKIKRPLFQDPKTGMRQRFSRPILQALEPRFHMELPRSPDKNEDGLPVVSGKVPLKIYLDERIKRYVTEQRYEVIYFVDFAFITEIEEGYSPGTWVWDSSRVINGEHILTVNIATFAGQVASASLRVFVQN